MVQSLRWAQIYTIRPMLVSVMKFQMQKEVLIVFPASGDFCRLLITITNNLDPDQARRFVGPDLGPDCL